jgi:signal transduction histidine kinase
VATTRRHRSLQARLALSYGGICFLLGLVVLAIPYGFGRASATSVVVPVRVTTDPSVQRAIVFAQRSADVHRQLVLSLVALVVLAALSASLGWLLAGRTLRPLRTITARTKEISASNLHRRLAVDGPYDELAELGATLDDLLARLEASFTSQRNFVSNASHELRTPLTAERALLQVALADPEPTVASLRAVCEELVGLGSDQERLIDELLTLAQSEGAVGPSERFDLATVARTGVTARGGEITRRGVRLELACSPAPVVADRRLVGIMVGNLLDNAVRHNVDGGTVTVRTTHRGRGSTLAVSNTGPLVPEDEVPYLCEPFRRAGDGGRVETGGHGLGLAIVRAVTEAHHAELQIRARRRGGLAVEVTFPPGSAATG